jgi:2'-5' RNA ligase
VSVRAFVAVDVDDAARADAFALADALGRAKAAPAGARWVPEGDMHVTLKFLGSVSDDAIGRIAAALPGLAARPAPSLVVGPLHAFPTPAKARVIILDVADDGTLAELAAALDVEPGSTTLTTLARALPRDEGRALLRAGDTVLVKGSRGVGLEVVARELAERSASAAGAPG